MTESSSGYEIHFEASEVFIQSLKRNEAGGHRIQRVPKTERRGRVHTSTCTVSALSLSEVKADSLSERDLQVQWFSGTGAGGQHRNKHCNSCRLIHKPTGFVSIAQTRSRQSSLAQAKEALEAMVNQAQQNVVRGRQQELRRAMVGSGQRGDKFRTYRFQDNRVSDDRSGKSATCTVVMKGGFDALWN